MDVTFDPIQIISEEGRCGVPVQAVVHYRPLAGAGKPAHDHATDYATITFYGLYGDDSQEVTELGSSTLPDIGYAGASVSPIAQATEGVDTAMVIALSTPREYEAIYYKIEDIEYLQKLNAVDIVFAGAAPVQENTPPTLVVGDITE